MAGKVSFTHPNKVLFLKLGITRQDLGAYYRDIGSLMLPYLKERPCNLLRQPHGIAGESFFQKNIEYPPDWLQTVKIYSESTQENVHYLVCKDLDHILYMLQLGCIEINPWNSRVDHLGKPDWMVIDLDPEGLDFRAAVKVAKTVHQVFEDWKIPANIKTSGKAGLHIFVPTGAKYSYKQVRKLAKAVAVEVNGREPKLTSVIRNPKKRRGKVYVDYLQNSEGQTLAAPYCVRPTPQASVSTPLHWDELETKLNPAQFTIKNIHKRIDSVGDLWKPVLGKSVDLEQTLKSLTS